MFKIVICSDQSTYVNQIINICKKYFLKINEEYTIDIYTKGLSLVKERESFDIAFININMPDINGIELAKMIRKYDKCIKIVFLTGFSEHITNAFSVHTFGYISEPFKAKEIEALLKDSLEDSVYNQVDFPTFIIKTDKGRELINVKNIYCLECNNHTIKLTTRTQTFFFNSSIKQLLSKLKRYGFEICHRSYLVNLSCIKQIRGYYVILDNGIQIPISQKKASAFKEKYYQYLESNYITL